MGYAVEDLLRLTKEVGLELVSCKERKLLVPAE